MSTVPSLEERYRRLLRALPEPARSRWSDEMTETYLEATCADDPEFAEYGSPELSDRLDVWQLALRLRLGGPGASARAVLTGATVRWVALLGVLATAAPAAFAQVARLVWADEPGPTGWQLTSGTVVAVLMVALFGCLVRGSAVTRPLAAGVLLVHLFTLVVGWSAPALVSTLLVVVQLAVPLVAAAVVDPAPARRPGRWWVGAAGAVLLVGGLPWVSLVLPVWILTGSAAAVGLVGVGVIALVRDLPPVAGAVAVLGAVSVPPLVSSALVGGPAGYVAAQTGVVATLALVALVCGVTAVRAARRLPAPTT